MRWWWAPMLILCGVCAAQGGGAGESISPDQLKDAHLRAAIDAMVAELYQRRDSVSLWEPTSLPSGESSRQGGGTTALVVHALLSAGESYQHPPLRDAIGYLESHGMDGTYAIAMRMHVWAGLPDQFLARLKEDAATLSNSFNPRTRCWDYTARVRNYEDNSIRQYGALALWEAARRGVTVDPKIWRALEQAALEQQLPDGGWGYRPGDPATGSMTTAGLTLLAITRDRLHRDRYVAVGQNTGPGHDAIERGFGWLERHFSPSTNPGLDDYFYYYLYGVERVGLASGRRTFGTDDWFRLGASELIARLCNIDPESGDASVHARTYGRGNRARIKSRELAFALLFLTRGRVPIVINKLRVDGMAWDNRPADVATLTERLAGESERRLNWQIIDASLPATDWLEAPLLYLASHEALPWVIEQGGTLPEDAVRLHEALERGGMLLAVNEGRRVDFARSVETVGSAMFPDLKWSDAGPAHWAYTLGPEPSGRRVRLRILSNGVRDVIVLIPRGDVPAALQTGARPGSGVWTTLANVALQASEKYQIRPCLDAAPRAPVPANATERVSIVRARYAGRWNPEPLALRRFGEWALSARGIVIDERAEDLAAIHTIEPMADLIVVEGIDAVTLDNAQRAAIRAYAERGGLILFATPGGIGSFTTAVRSACEAMFGVPARLILGHPIVTGEELANAPPLTRIGYRPYAIERFGTRETAPRLQGIFIDGELRVMFSDEDIAHGLLGTSAWGVAGYDTPSARAILANMLQYAIQRRKNAGQDDVDPSSIEQLIRSPPDDHDPPNAANAHPR